MSFDVFLQHFERGDPAPSHREAVAAVLRELEAKGPDEGGHYHVLVSDVWEMLMGHDGAVVECEILSGPGARPSQGHKPYHLPFWATGLEGEEEFSGCAFFLHAFSPGIADVMFRIAEAGGMAVIPAAEIGPLLPPTADPGDLPEGMSPPHRIASGGDLYSALMGEYGRYIRWRDQVIPGAASRRPWPRGLARGIRDLGRKWLAR